MKKIAKLAVVLAASALLFGCNEKSSKAKIGIAKIQQHPALDAAEKGIIDVINEAGLDVEFDLQNANADLNTANQIALKYKDENVKVAVGIATPIAVALANTIKQSPVIFAAVTDPVGADLVSTLEHGENNVTGMSDAVPTDLHIELFAEVTGIKTLGYIYTSSEANSQTSLKLVQDACAKLGLGLVTQAISSTNEVKQAAEAIIDRVDGIYLTTDNTVFSALSGLVQVFGDARKPIFSADVTGAMAGGCLLASGFNYYKAGRATGDIIVDILKNGKKPDEIPVRFMTEPSDSDFLIDLDVAKNCGITIPSELLKQANLIFENGKLRERN
ncbi:MAG: ABC transporter substrate-binding protein [Treponema sp.]|nr:ABC transporter substrate-binding protein [Treponema sp.]